MKIKNCLPALLIILQFIIACSESSTNSTSESLLGNISITNINKAETVGVSDIFGKNHRILKFSVPGDSELMAIRKVIKKDGIFYICTGSAKIHLFDDSAQYISTLSMQGKAKYEYPQLSDFDVRITDGKRSIYILSEQKINIYEQRGDSWECEDILEFGDIFLDRFAVTENAIIAKIRGEQTLMIADLEGNIKETFLPVNPNCDQVRFLQFVNVGDSYTFQIGSSNSCVEIAENLEHRVVDIVESDEKVLTIEDVERIAASGAGYFEIFDQSAESYLNLTGFKPSGDRTYMVYMTKMYKQRYLVVKDENSVNSYSFFGDKVNVKDDILGVENLAYLATMLNHYSDNSLILAFESPVIEGKTMEVQSEKGIEKVLVTSNDNDCILEFTIEFSK